MGGRIARRDFVNGTLIASGLGAFASKTGASTASTEWDGYDGVGDYKDARPPKVVTFGYFFDRKFRGSCSMGA